jgi:hypothetical protein
MAWAAGVGWMLLNRCVACFAGILDSKLARLSQSARLSEKTLSRRFCVCLELKSFVFCWQYLFFLELRPTARHKLIRILGIM